MQNQEEKSKIKTGEEERKLVMLQNILELQSRCSFFLLPVQTMYLLKGKNDLSASDVSEKGEEDCNLN